MTHFYNPPRNLQQISKKHILAINEPNELELALSSPDFPQIKFLKMKNSNINDESTKCLVKVTSELQIEKIDLSENFSFITDATIVTLSNCKSLHRLISINLADNNITDDGVRVMCDSGIFSRLRELILYGNSSITSQALVCIAESEWIKALDTLDLHATSIGDEGLDILFQSENSACLESLDLSMSWNKVTDFALESLARSKYACKLRKLNLQDCNISDQGTSQLFRSQNCQMLEELNLSNSIDKMNNIISDATLKDLAISKTIRNLKRLFLKATRVSSDGIKSLTSSPIFERLQVLKLSHCPEIDENALLYLGSMLLYSNLNKLHVNSTSINRQTAAKFEEKYPQVNTIY